MISKEKISVWQGPKGVSGVPGAAGPPGSEGGQGLPGISGIPGNPGAQVHCTPKLFKVHITILQMYRVLVGKFYEEFAYYILSMKMLPDKGNIF